MNFARVDWSDPTGPRDPESGDIFFQPGQGFDEARHVFVEPTKLLERDTPLLKVLEVGFGSGLNFLTTATLLRRHRPNTRLQYVGIETRPWSCADVKRLLACTPELDPSLVQPFVAQLPQEHIPTRTHVLVRHVVLDLYVGTHASHLSGLQGDFDAIFLDGFAPAKDTDFWSDGLFEHVGNLLKPDGLVATFSAARRVKDGFAHAKLKARVVPGFANKRDMLVAEQTEHHRPNRTPPWLHQPHARTVPQSVGIVGAGLSGCALAYALGLRGISSVVFDPQGVAGGASGHRALLAEPMFASGPSVQSDFYLQAWQHWSRSHGTLPGFEAVPTEVHHHQTSRRSLGDFEKIGQRTPHCRVDHADGTLTFTQAWLLSGALLCRAYLKAAATEVVQETVTGADRDNDGIAVQTEQATYHFDALVFANAYSEQTVGGWPLPEMLPVSGSVLEAPAWGTSCEHVHQNDVLMIPNHHGRGYVGATFHRGHARVPNPDDDQRELIRRAALQGISLNASDDVAVWTGTRASTADRLPLVGSIFEEERYREQFAKLPDGLPWHKFGPARPEDGVWCSVGHGSRGSISTLLAAEQLASLLCGEVCPVPGCIAQSMHPARFWARALKRN